MDGFKAKIDRLKNNYERDTNAKAHVIEEQKEMAEQLKTVQKTANKNKEIVTELSKLQNQNLRVLQGEVGELHK